MILRRQGGEKQAFSKLEKHPHFPVDPFQVTSLVHSPPSQMNQSFLTLQKLRSRFPPALRGCERWYSRDENRDPAPCPRYRQEGACPRGKRPGSSIPSKQKKQRCSQRVASSLQGVTAGAGLCSASLQPHRDGAVFLDGIPICPSSPPCAWLERCSACRKILGAGTSAAAAPPEPLSRSRFVCLHKMEFYKIYI